MFSSPNFLYVVFIVAVSLTTFNFTTVSAEINPGIGNYTMKERKAIEKFRLLVGSELYKDYMRRDEYLIRWIWHQNFNLEKARDKLLMSLKWRKENNIDNVLREDFSDLEKLCPSDLSGHDKSGRPILALSIGSCPIRKIVLSGNMERLKRLFYFAYELCSKIVRDSEKPVRDGIVIGDLSGFSWREHGCFSCIPLVIELLTLYDSHYPWFIHRVYAINVPKAFEGIISIAMPLLSERSREIFQVYGFNKDEWKSDLLKNISSDQLQRQFGGTKIKQFKPLSPLTVEIAKSLNLKQLH